MFKKISIVFFSVILFLMNVFPSFAAVASPSVASPSVALPMEEYFETDSFDTLSIPEISVMSDSDVTDYQVFGHYSDSSGTPRSVEIFKNSDGFYFGTAPGTYEFGSFSVRINSSVFPEPGNYGLRLNIRQGNIDYMLASCRAQVHYSSPNVTGSTSNSDIESWQNTGIFYTATANVTVYDNMEYITFRFYFDVGYFSSTVDLGSISCTFSQMEWSSADDIGSSSFGKPNSDQIQQSVSDNTAQLVEGQDNIMDTIKEQVQYITLQLEAFWNQLAAQFSNLFNKMNEQFSELMSGIEDQTNEINNQIEESTDEITRGYDNSSLNNSANEYHQADQELENAQNAAWDQGAGRIEDFDFGEFDFSPGVMAALSYCGNWLQNVFVGISFFNLPITIGLTIVFALMIIGYYRYH